jgi:hypothetical protein
MQVIHTSFEDVEVDGTEVERTLIIEIHANGQKYDTFATVGDQGVRGTLYHYSNHVGVEIDTTEDLRKFGTPVSLDDHRTWEAPLLQFARNHIPGA